MPNEASILKEMDRLSDDDRMHERAMEMVLLATEDLYNLQYESAAWKLADALGHLQGLVARPAMGIHTFTGMGNRLQTVTPNQWEPWECRNSTGK